MKSDYPFDSPPNVNNRHKDAWEEINQMKGGFKQQIAFAKQFIKEDLGEFVTKITNSSTTNFIEKLYDTIMISGEPVKDNPEAYKIPKELNTLIKSTMDLYDENIDIEKSLKRGYRDLIKGNPLKTEMRKKIRDKVLNPLKEYINREDIQTFMTKEEINSKLDALEKKYLSDEIKR